MNSTALICECIRAEAGRFYFMLSDFNWFIIVMSVQIILTINFSSNRQLNSFGADLTFSCHCGQGHWYFVFFKFILFIGYTIVLPLRIEQLNVYDRFLLLSKTFLTTAVLKNSKKPLKRINEWMVPLPSVALSSATLPRWLNASNMKVNITFSRAPGGLNLN